MRPAAAATWVALALVAAAWLCRLVWIAVPALDVNVNHAAEALYLAELEYQHHGVAIVEAPSIESIATEVHRRTARVLIWIGLGLGLCLVGAMAPHSRRVMIVVAGLVYLLGWIRLDAYAHVGLLHGLDLKLRLVQHDAGRLLRFAVIDGVLPLLVTCAIATTTALALKRA